MNKKYLYGLLLLPLLSVFLLHPFSQSTEEKLEALRNQRDRLGIEMQKLKQGMTINESLQACQKNPLNSIIDCASANHDSREKIWLSPPIAPVEPSQASNSEATDDVTYAAKIDAYFRDRAMPLEGLGQDFVNAAKKCDLDPFLLPSIAVKESSGGKVLFRKKNPFGYGRMSFETFKEAIDYVSDSLCGLNPKTERYYKDADTDKILWHYNGTVNRRYPGNVKWIMEKIRNY